MVIPVHDENGIARPGFRAWVVWSLVAANVAVFALLALLSTPAALVIGYNFGVVPAVLLGAPEGSALGLTIWPAVSLVTYSFLHASWLHLTANMIVLWVLGDDIEAATGHIRFVVLYFLCGAAGAIAQALSDTQSLAPIIGASGSVAGVAGAYLLLRPHARMTVLVLGLLTVRLRAYWVIAFWIAWQVFNIWWPISETRTAYWTHVGGFAAGLSLILVMRRRGVPLFA
ncbi:MAG: rhomboid family intramembrane serine protease [Pseudorhodoplanes sp.]|nr:MAG: rhomboid family intramembrane serine protease [Pseudorhodoplanes sp.]